MSARRRGPIPTEPEASKKISTGKMKKGVGFGSTITIVAFICVQLLCSPTVKAQSTTVSPTLSPCNRLLMKGMDRDDSPWLQLAGIYHLDNFTADSFPVYKHESISMYFYYNRSVEQLSFGAPHQVSPILVGAFTNGRTSSVTAGAASPFYYMITGWYQYDPDGHRYDVQLSGGKQRIEPTCVADDMTTCLSGMLEFDENLKQIDGRTGVVTDFNILGLDYYKQIPGRYINNRPVYRKMRGDVDTGSFLYNRAGRWLIAENYLDSWSGFKTEDTAMRPEHILSKWESKTNGAFVYVNARLRCRALTADKACGASAASQCLNGGTCQTSADGVRRHCACAPGYRGLYCEEQLSSCPLPTELLDRINAVEGSRRYFSPSLYEGSVLTIFRGLDSWPNYWFSTCNGRSWPSDHITLQATTTAFNWNDRFATTTASTTRSSRYVFEWNDPVAATVLGVMVMVMQVINPLIIWCVAFCISFGCASRVEQKDKEKLQDLTSSYQTRLDAFRRDHPEPEEDYDEVCVAQLARINDDYQRQSQEFTEREEARKKKSLVKMKLSRVFSLYAYCTFWIFLLYVILVCTTRLFGGVVFLVLCIFCAIFVFVSHLIVMLEYKWCSERQYLGNLSSSVFAVDRIEVIRATQPFIFLRAECYHYETRTRTVFYTDANGNLQSREESYQEKVVTNLFLDPFNFQYWKDTSPPELVGISDKGITKIKMTLSVEPGDEETRLELDSQYQAFKDVHQFEDVFVDFTIVNQVEGFEKRLAAYTDNREKPVWVSSAAFMVASFLFLSWPYRWAFNSITSKTEFAVSKLVYLGLPPEEDINLSTGVDSQVAICGDDSGEDQCEIGSIAVTIESDLETTDN